MINLVMKSNEVSMNLLSMCHKVKANVSTRGRTYKVGSVLSLVALGYLCNINTAAGISRFGRRLTRSQLRKLGFTKYRSPCHSTILETLNRIDVSDLERTIYEEKSEADKNQIIDIDGKCLRGSKCMGEKGLHILGAFFNKMLSSVGQVMLSKEENEITGMLKLLETIDITGKTITGDAIFSQKKIVESIIEKGGDFVFTVKDNQENLKNEIKKAFAEVLPENLQEYSEGVDKVHGRIEERSIKMIEMPWEYNNEWRHIKKIGRITRVRQKKVKGKWHKTEEEAYVITSCKTVSAQELLKINREHWSVERIHWIRDVVFREDNCTVHKRTASQVLTALRNVVIACIKKISNTYTATREKFAHKPQLAFKVLFATG
jgi:predicted transposase YbfD/YdcC